MKTKEEIQKRLASFRRSLIPNFDLSLSDVYPVQLNYAGGMQGGNCWGREPHIVFPYEEKEVGEQAMKLSTDIREHIPNFHLTWDLFKTAETTETDYYGNYDDWELTYILLDDLYKVYPELKELLQ